MLEILKLLLLFELLLLKPLEQGQVLPRLFQLVDYLFSFLIQLELLNLLELVLLSQQDVLLQLEIAILNILVKQEVSHLLRSPSPVLSHGLVWVPFVIFGFSIRLILLAGICLREFLDIPMNHALQYIKLLLVLRAKRAVVYR